MIKGKSDFLEKAYPFIITAIFLALSIILITRHELWRDEVISWHFGSESSSFVEFMNIIKVDGNNTLGWFSILYFISHFITDNIESMKIAHLVISTISVFLFLKYAPFNRVIKIIFVFGYFPFYEYSIISRNYALGILFIVIFCILYKNKYKNIILLGITLFLMGQGSVLSFIISIAFFLMLIFELTIDWKNINKVHFLITVLIVITGIFFTCWQLGSQEAISSMSTSTVSVFNRIIGENFKSVKNVSAGIIDAYIPIPQFILNYWDRDRLITHFLSKYSFFYTFLLSLILFIIPVFIIKRKKIFPYLVASMGIIFIPLFIRRCYSRHFGHLFILFIACLWLSNMSKDDKYLINLKSNFNKIFQNIFLVGILIASIIASPVAFYFDYKYPFSNGKYVANYIEENFNKDSIIIVGYQDYAAETISGYLDKDIYYPNSKNFKKSVSWVNRLPTVNPRDIFSEAYHLAKKNEKVLAVIHFETLNEAPTVKYGTIPESFFFEKMDVEFTDSIVCTENYYLYLFDNNKFSENYLPGTVYKIDRLNFQQYFKPINECEFGIKNDYVWIKVYGDDPWFETTFPIDFNGNKSLLALFDIDSSIDGEFEIFFKRSNGDYTANDSLKYHIYKGNNVFYIEIPYSEDLIGLRIDPINVESDCFIREIRLYNSKD